MPRWIPNFFTLSRLLLVPVIIRAILTRRATEAAVLFACAAATDVIDGATARAFRITSQFGAYMDPIADKALLSGVFLALALAGDIPWWLVLIIFGRDLYLLSAVAVLMWLTPRRKFAPSIWGKASTFVQILTALCWMARNMLGAPPLNAISTVMLWPCAAVTIWSGLEYTWRGLQLARVH
jgi:cardiolipin synthase